MPHEMTDSEVQEIGRMTLHGPLPQTTVMRLFNAAIRLIDEKENLKARLAEEGAAKQRLRVSRDEMRKQRDVALANHGDALSDWRAAVDVNDMLRNERDNAVKECCELRTKVARTVKAANKHVYGPQDDLDDASFIELVDAACDMADKEPPKEFSEGEDAT